MRLLLQRVRRARVLDVEAGEVLGEIGTGLLVLAGFGPDDDSGAPSMSAWERMLSKVVKLRIFPDEQGKLNLDVQESGGSLLVVSQFTLYADCRRGRRPSFSCSAPPAVAEPLYERLLEDFGKLMPGKVRRGRFGADMDVELVNWGPVTIWLDSGDFA